MPGKWATLGSRGGLSRSRKGIIRYQICLARSVRSKSTFQRVWRPSCEREKRKGYDVEVVRLSEALRVNGCDASNIHATEKRRKLNIQLSGTIMLYTTEDRRGAIFIIIFIVIIIRGVCTQRSERSSNSGRICLAKEGRMDCILTIETIGLTSFLLERR